MHCLGWSGHVYPLLAVGKALLARGHQVALLTATAYRSTVEATGVTYFPPKQASDRDYNQLEELFPAFRRLPNAEVLARLFGGMAVQDAATQGHDVAVACAEWRPDTLINDGVTLGTPLAGGLLGLPWATVSPFLFCTIPAPDVPPPFLGMPWSGGPFGRRVAIALNRLADLRLAAESRHWRSLARAWRLPHFPPTIRQAGASPLLYLYPGGPPLEYPRRQWPAHMHGVGPLLLAQGTPITEPPAQRPRVFLTEGTTHTDDGLSRLAMRALGNAPVDLLIALGGRPAATLGPVPANTRIVGYVDYRMALAGAALLITNGGAGSLAAALEAGVPALILPAGLDKREAAQRLAWSGAGLRLPAPAHCSVERLREAALALVNRPAYRRRAQRVGRELMALGGADGAATLLEAVTSDGVSACT